MVEFLDFGSSSIWYRFYFSSFALVLNQDLTARNIPSHPPSRSSRRSCSNWCFVELLLYKVGPFLMVECDELVDVIEVMTGSDDRAVTTLLDHSDRR